MRSLLTLACLAGLAVPTVALAANGDLRPGSFQGEWCRYEAIYDLEEQVPGKWIFHGTITLPRTGQVDRLWVEQHADNSLRIIRYLSGGQVQNVKMAPPVGASSTEAAFYSVTSEGPGCAGKRSTMYVPQ